MENTYGFSIRTGARFADATEAVSRQLKRQGFGIVTDIDMQALFKEKLAIDDRPYRIIGACNPMLAHQALRADPDIGLLLPCNVVVREDKEGSVTVSFTAPEALLSLTCMDELVDLGREVRQRLERVRDAVAVELHADAA